jgi:hypothetical protein
MEIHGSHHGASLTRVERSLGIAENANVWSSDGTRFNKELGNRRITEIRSTEIAKNPALRVEHGCLRSRSDGTGAKAAIFLEPY